MEIVTSADGTRIAYDAVGAGPAVILVGGAFQHRAIDERTARLADRRGEGFTVVHYDAGAGAAAATRRPTPPPARSRTSPP
jgi:hypothetical protein